MSVEARVCGSVIPIVFKIYFLICLGGGSDANLVAFTNPNVVKQEINVQMQFLLRFSLLFGMI